MSTWHEHFQATGTVPAWPYPVRYGRETVLSADVLVLGGGIAGCHAAINARRAGASVIVLEKAAAKWSGNGGAGVDHWLSACTNPCSKVSPEEFTARVSEDCGGYDCGPLRYIHSRDGWDTLLDCESMGVRIRDVEDEFEGAAFRDPASKLLFAYDYENRIDIRVFGHDMKPRLAAEMARLGVEVRDRVMVSSLLTGGDGESRRVVGATGVHARTGEFVVALARAVILATGLPGRLWVHSSEYRSAFRDPNLACDGMAAAWNAGAEFVRLEDSAPDGASLAYIAYGVGNAHNTWHGCPIVDAEGKEVPWVDRDGRVLGSLLDRFRPSPGQPFMVAPGLRVPVTRENHVPELAPDLPDRIRRGEFVLPLYADLTRLPAHERRAIFGLMVGNEGKTRIPVYDALTRAGFDPDLDMLQAPVMPPDAYGHANFWAGVPVPQWRQWGGGGLLVDWDLATSLPGLYAAGGAVYGAGAHSSAAASGRWAGRQAAAHAAGREAPSLPREQVDREKSRAYAPLAAKPHALGWKELNAGICRVMQDHCGAFRSGRTLEAGVRLLRGIAEGEAARAHAANPHELVRVLECLSLLTAGQAVMQASLARRASSAFLGFHRIDFPRVDPPEWRKLLPIRKEADGARVRELAPGWHLAAPCAGTCEENYRLRARGGGTAR
jgi:succinate dehydrogenase/fumarate reductase flavoprotein subunit